MNSSLHTQAPKMCSVYLDTESQRQENSISIEFIGPFFVRSYACFAYNMKNSEKNIVADMTLDLWDSAGTACMDAPSATLAFSNYCCCKTRHTANGSIGRASVNGTLITTDNS